MGIAVYDGRRLVKFANRGNMKRTKRVSGATLSMTPNPEMKDFNLRVDLLGGVMLRVQEKAGAFSLSFLKWPEEEEAEGGLSITYTDENCHIHKEAVGQKDDSFFKKLNGMYFDALNHMESWCPVRHTDGACS